MPPRLPLAARSGVARAVLSLSLLSVNGCTIVGATIGSSIPKHEPLSPVPVANRASEGQPIDVETRQRRVLSGSYEGTYDDKLWVRTEDGDTAVPSSDVRRAELHQGNYFLEGLLTGIALDVTAIAILGATASEWLPKKEGSYRVGADGVDVAGR